MKDIFKDLTVIELAGVLAGPSVGAFFAELGARVVKVENPKTNGDVTRSWKLPLEDAAKKGSAYYWSVNGGKEVLFLDISQRDDLEKLYSLLRTADIVITNFKKDDDVKLKVSYAELQKINPQLIYAAVSGFGEESARTAYDLILQAEAGYMLINGEPGGQPVKMPVALIDVLAGHQLKEAILIALLKRAKEKQGSHITVSLFDSAVASLVNQATNWLVAGHVPEAMGSRHPNIAPYGELFTTRDGQLVTFAIGSDRQFGQLCNLLGLEVKPDYSSNQLRVENRSQLSGEIGPLVTNFNFDLLYAKCLEMEIPVGKLRNLKEVFDLPEAKAMLKRFQSPDGVITAVNSIAFKFIDACSL